MNTKQLYRAVYARGSTVVGVTFSAADLIAAVRWSEAWERMTGCPVLTLKPEPASPFTKQFYQRRASCERLSEC